MKILNLSLNFPFPKALGGKVVAAGKVLLLKHARLEDEVVVWELVNILMLTFRVYTLHLRAESPSGGEIPPMLSLIAGR